MPIRLEFTPIKVNGLGRFGLDHLMLVYQQAVSTNQDTWYVIEGVKGNPMLLVDGEDGRLTLSEANGDRTAQALVDYLGTPMQRGTRVVPVLDAFSAWETMATIARDIEGEFAYSVLGIPGTVRPTSNSTSLIATLLYYVGIDIMTVLPFGMRVTSGLHTLLGQQSNDEISTTPNFTTVQAGLGHIGI